MGLKWSFEKIRMILQEEKLPNGGLFLYVGYLRWK